MPQSLFNRPAGGRLPTRFCQTFRRCAAEPCSSSSRPKRIYGIASRIIRYSGRWTFTSGSCWWERTCGDTPIKLSRKNRIQISRRLKGQVFKRGETMKPFWLYRVAAVLLLLFSAGHTVGFRKTKPEWGIDAIVNAMKTTSFDVNGFPRPHWDFYVRFGLFVSLLLLFAA